MSAFRPKADLNFTLGASMRTIFLAFLGLSFALSVAAQQPSQSDRPAVDPKASADAKADAKAKIEASIKRCQENRGVDCESKAGLTEFMQVERSREEPKPQDSDGTRQSTSDTPPRSGDGR